MYNLPTVTQAAFGNIFPRNLLITFLPRGTFSYNFTYTFRMVLGGKLYSKKKDLSEKSY